MTNESASAPGYDAQGNRIPFDYDYNSKLSDVLKSIESEVLKAKQHFPADFHNQHEAYAVILEEVEELWAEIKKNHKNYDFPAQRKEATQAAAMMTRMLVELL